MNALDESVDEAAGGRRNALRVPAAHGGREAWREFLREDAIDAAWRSFNEYAPISREDFGAYCAGFDVEPVIVADKVVGAVLMRAAEVCALIAPEGRGRWVSRGLIRRTVQRTIAQFGYAVTYVPGYCVAGHHMAWRLGFRPQGVADGGLTTYVFRPGVVPETEWASA